MNITINLSQLVTGAVSSAVNGVSILIASRYFSKALEKVEKKAVNGKPKE
jgi:galactitol-specific phosphotransferase system IIB component